MLGFNPIRVHSTPQGNWATDIGGGAKFGYNLLFAVLVSSLTGMLFQFLCIKLGVVTGLDLAQQCRAAFHPYVTYFLYFITEVAIIATDLAEVSWRVPLSLDFPQDYWFRHRAQPSFWDPFDLRRAYHRVGCTGGTQMVE